MIWAGVFSRVYKGEILKQQFKEGLGEIQGGLNKVKGMLQRRDFKGELKEGLGEHLIN